MFRTTVAAIALTFAALSAQAGEIASSVDAGALPKKKQTPLGLYVTPSDAHAALQADPGIVFIDVRDPVEVSFVGHAQGMDANIPVATASRKFNPKAGRYEMTPNKGFIAQASAIIQREGGTRDTPVFLICRSGGRSAKAARALINAGYTNVWNLIEGFEGDMNKATGTRSLNGWRNAGLPWAYKIPADAAWQPE